MSVDAAAVACQRRVSYSEVLRVPQFRAVFLAQLLSMLGDRAAAVALAVLVYDRSGSPVLTATVFALTFLPHLFAAPFATVVDRFPRRTVLVVCDLVRIPMVLAMLIPDVPLAVLFVLLALVTLFEVPHEAARAVITRNVLDDEQYPVGMALGATVAQAALLLGSIGGGLLVATLSVNSSLLLDAATFAVAAALARFSLDRHAPVIDLAAPEAESPKSGLMEAVRIVLAPGPRQLLLLTLVVCVAGAMPEGLAVPYADELGGGASLAGLIAAADAGGAVLAGLILPRLLTLDQQRKAVLPVGVVALLAVTALATQPPAAVALLLLVLAGVGGATTMLTGPIIMSAAPDSHRGRVYGVASTALVAAQGLGIAAGSLLAETISVSIAMASVGFVGLLLIGLVQLDALRASAAVPPTYQTPIPVPVPVAVAAG